MPELPEVEVTRLGLEGPLREAQVQAVRGGKPLRWPLGCAVERLVGRRIGALQRRGKYLWMPLLAPAQGPSPEPDGGLLWHLGMSGSLALLPAPAPAPGPHDHFDLVTTAGTLRLNDPRRFGAVVWSAALDRPPAATLLQRLGAEPLDPGFSAAALHTALKRRKVAIKTVLLAGDIVVGAGNIYASEALFVAGIDPRRRSDRLALPRCAALLEALRTVLHEAVALGGSTLRDFQDAHGMAGAYQQRARVYGREGQRCGRCGAAVRRLVQGQRATYFCAGCQR